MFHLVTENKRTGVFKFKMNHLVIALNKRNECNPPYASISGVYQPKHVDWWAVLGVMSFVRGNKLHEP